MMAMNMSAKQLSMYAARGNLREARYARLAGEMKKAAWHLALAAKYRRDSIDKATGSAQ
jgi:hypothetical protein